jgi:mono/diheme cytochrome c family protein
MGKVLYDKACGICHEAAHRATMVTDLRTKVPNNAEYWKFSIVHGKPGTLMPAFSQAEGGPLSDAQIASLVEYLVKEYPTEKPKAVDPHAGHAH